jgi:hypothetical protein
MVHISRKSEEILEQLLQVKGKTIGPIATLQDKIGDIIDNCHNRNEAIVLREITPLILPPIHQYHLCGASHLKHVVDEINADWYNHYVLQGPRLRPDVSVGLSSSAFTEEEIDKLKRYHSVENWTQLTTHMYFPGIMCEVKCGRQGLDIADRQSMHSSSVAIKAILRSEQVADEYRRRKAMETKMDSLSGRVLVFSISYNSQDARVYGHFARVQGEKWSYYRRRVRKYDFTDPKGLPSITSNL